MRVSFLFLFFARNQVQLAATVLDVGCNRGLASLPIAALGFNVVCFEPVSYSIERLKQSKLINGFEKMTIVHAALGDTNKEVEVQHTHIRTYTCARTALFLFSFQIFVPDEREDNTSLHPDVSTANLPGLKHKSEKTQMVKLDTWLAQNPQVHKSHFF